MAGIATLIVDSEPPDACCPPPEGCSCPSSGNNDFPGPVR